MIFLFSFWFQVALAASSPKNIELRSPIDCQIGRDCEIYFYFDHKGRDFKCGNRAKPGHDGTDFAVSDPARAREGVKVVASAPGKVYRVENASPDISVNDASSPPGQEMSCGNGVAIAHADGWTTQVCHLRKDSLKVKVGEIVKEGQELGLVGLSGSTEFYHVHLTVARDNKQVDPFAYGARETCDSGLSLFKSDPLYKPRLFLGGGFTDDGQYSFKDIESNSRLPRPKVDGRLYIYAYVLGLKRGDRIRTQVLSGGRTLFTDEGVALEKDKAAYGRFIGTNLKVKNSPTRGVYMVRFEVLSATGEILLTQNYNEKL